jgi:hypothetical protein
LASLLANYKRFPYRLYCPLNSLIWTDKAKCGTQCLRVTRNIRIDPGVTTISLTCRREGRSRHQWPKVICHLDSGRCVQSLLHRFTYIPRFVVPEPSPSTERRRRNGTLKTLPIREPAGQMKTETFQTFLVQTKTVMFFREQFVMMRIALCGRESRNENLWRQ